VRWTYETFRQKVKREKQWHKWFAWFPVVDGNGNAFWLEHVERRLDPIAVMIDISSYEYRTISLFTVGGEVVRFNPDTGEIL